MNKKEIAEIKKQFTPVNCTITRICGCYVDAEKNKKTKIKEAFLSLPEEEMFKYFDIFKKTMSGRLGKNLMNLDFPLSQEKEGGTQEFLMRIRASKLKNDELLDELYDKVIENYDYHENYYIVLIHAVYDIPGRLVCSMANEMIEKHQKSVKFTTSLKILDEIKSTWGERGKNAENKLISDLTYADILIIDDFGAESGKDWINEKFYGIINGRYADKKTTIFTSNYPISRLKYDDRITNRILERSLEIPFPEESVREHIADAMKQELIKKIQGGENGKQV